MHKTGDQKRTGTGLAGLLPFGNLNLETRGKAKLMQHTWLLGIGHSALSYFD